MYGLVWPDFQKGNTASLKINLDRDFLLILIFKETQENAYFYCLTVDYLHMQKSFFKWKSNAKKKNKTQQKQTKYVLQKDNT